ncbi:MAG: hypothetical protein M3680_12070 [Myxococcota bacterium]|nr:hypothetical protein [Myxococcota bacterium]
MLWSFIRISANAIRGAVADVAAVAVAGAGLAFDPHAAIAAITSPSTTCCMCFIEILLLV